MTPRTCPCCVARRHTNHVARNTSTIRRFQPIYLGGALAGTRPRYHYFVADRTQVHGGVRRLLELGVHTFYVGHGGPLTAQEVQAWLEEKVGGG
jgi:hypothetical protein